jgi:hypothetical protein
VGCVAVLWDVVSGFPAGYCGGVGCICRMMRCVVGCACTGVVVCVCVVLWCDVVVKCWDRRLRDCVNNMATANTSTRDLHPD